MSVADLRQAMTSERRFSYATIAMFGSGAAAAALFRLWLFSALALACALWLGHLTAKLRKLGNQMLAEMERDEKRRRRLEEPYQ